MVTNRPQLCRHRAPKAFRSIGEHFGRHCALGHV